MVDVIPDDSWGRRAANRQYLNRPEPIVARPKPQEIDWNSLLGASPQQSSSGRDILSRGKSLSEYGNGSNSEEESGDDSAWWETPIVQGIVDLISVGGYSTASVASELQDSFDMFQEGDFLGAAGNALISPITGTAQGWADALSIGDTSETTTWSDVIDRGIEDFGGDNDSETANNIEAWGGLAGDILLDPLTYASLGLFPLAKGAIKGSSSAARAAKTIKAGDTSIADQTTSKLTGAKEGAKKEYTAYRQGIKDQRQMRKDKRTIKKARKNGDGELIEQAIRESVPGYARLPHDTLELEGGLAAKAVTNAEEAVTEAIEKVAPTIDESLMAPAPRSEYSNTAKIPDSEKVVKPAEVIDNIPAEFKMADYAKFTPVDRFVLALQKFATTVPKYTSKQMEDMNAVVNRVPANITNTIKPAKYNKPLMVKSLKNHKGMITGKEGTPVSPTRLATQIAKGGKTAERAMAQLPDSILKRFETEPAVTETVPNPLGIPEDELIQAGADPKDVLDIQINGKVDSDNFRVGAGSRYDAILTAMARGEYSDQPEAMAQFKEFFENFSGRTYGTTKELALAAGKYSRGLQLGKRNSPEAKAHREAIAKSTKSFKPTAIEGHMAQGKSGPAVGIAHVASKVIDPDKWDAYRRGLAPQAAEEISEDYLNDARALIQDHQFANQIAEASAEIFKKTYNKQKTPTGPYRTKEGWSSSTEKLIDGEPKKEYWWTTATFIDQFTEVAKQTSKILNDANLGSSAARQKHRDDVAMRMFGYIDAQVKGYGIFPYLTNVMPENSFMVRLSGFDVLRSMTPAMRNKYLWTKKGDIHNVNMTMLMDLSETLMRSVSEIGYEGAVDYAHIKPKALQALMGKFRSSEVNRVIDENLDPQTQAFNEKIIDANKKMVNAVGKRMEVFQDLYKEFTEGEVVGKLAARLLENTSRSATNLSKEIVETTTDTYARIDQAIAQGSVGSAIEILAEIPRKVTDPAGNRVMQSEHQAALNSLATQTEQEIAKLSNKNAKLFSNRAKKNAGIQQFPVGPKLNRYGQQVVPNTAKTKPMPQQKEVNANNAEIAEKATSTALKTENLKQTAETMNDDQLISMVMKDGAYQEATRWFGFEKMFNPRLGMDKSYDVLTSGMHSITHLQSNFHDGILNNIMRKRYTPEQLKLGFKALQADDLTNPIAREFKEVVDYLFEPSNNNFFTRNGVGAKHMNEVMDAMGLNKMWRFGTGDPNEIVTPDMMNVAWKQWTNIENPIKALEIIHSAMVKTSTDISMAARFSTHFGRKNIDQLSNAEKKQWVKIGDTGKNQFAKLIDLDRYYPRWAVDELPRLGQLITESRSWKEGTKLKLIVEGVIDPITSALKLTQTTMKPGHHVMSVIGDLMRNSLAGMDVSTKEYRQMWRIIRSRQMATKEMSGFDQYARVRDVTNQVDVTGGTTAKGRNADSLTLVINGKETNVSLESLYSLMEQRDIILPGHVGGIPEDLMYDFTSTPADMSELPAAYRNSIKAADKFGRGVNKIANNRFIGLSKFSAERDNLMRGALALHFMQSKKFKSVQEAIEYASINVKKWAPTSQDLANAESKYMRRGIFYYTWLRGILPRIVESVMNRPGWSSIPSKGMFAIAEANGLDPQSFGNPFPELEEGEVKYPEWYRDGVLGPQWKDDDGYEWGISPTSPVLDVFGSLGSGATLKGLVNPDSGQNSFFKVGQTLMGMMHPALKAPVELGQGSSLSTGAPIWDTSEYFTDMLGPVRTASRITGHNIAPDPNAMFLPRRTESKYAEGLGSAEEWQDNAAIELWNYITGTGLTNYNSDSSVTSAEFAEREKNRNDERYQNRTEWWQ